MINKTIISAIAAMSILGTASLPVQATHVAHIPTTKAHVMAVIPNGTYTGHLNYSSTSNVYNLTVSSGVISGTVTVGGVAYAATGQSKTNGNILVQFGGPTGTTNQFTGPAVASGTAIVGNVSYFTGGVYVGPATFTS